MVNNYRNVSNCAEFLKSSNLIIESSPDTTYHSKHAITLSSFMEDNFLPALLCDENQWITCYNSEKCAALEGALMQGLNFCFKKHFFLKIRVIILTRWHKEDRNTGHSCYKQILERNHSLKCTFRTK